jgi:hypothetical protein
MCSPAQDCIIGLGVFRFSRKITSCTTVCCPSLHPCPAGMRQSKTARQFAPVLHRLLARQSAVIPFLAFLLFSSCRVRPSWQRPCAERRCPRATSRAGVDVAVGLVFSDKRSVQQIKYHCRELRYSVSAKRTASCERLRDVAMLRHDATYKADIFAASIRHKLRGALLGTNQRRHHMLEAYCTSGCCSPNRCAGITRISFHLT